MARAKTLSFLSQGGGSAGFTRKKDPPRPSR